ncbi:hypothetical protein L915_17108, partial [Phytophthora nicotianae]
AENKQLLPIQAAHQSTLQTSKGTGQQKAEKERMPIMWFHSTV